MIRMLGANQYIDADDIAGKYVWSEIGRGYRGRNPQWTANAYPSYVHDVVQRNVESYLKTYRETPALRNGERVLTGYGTRVDDYDIKVNSVFCVCDTADEVNLVRALGATIRDQYREFETAYEDRLKRLDNSNQPLGINGIIRMPDLDTPLGAQDVRGCYVWRRRTTWTAHPYPSYVSDVVLRNRILSMKLQKRSTFDVTPDRDLCYNGTRKKN